MRARAGGLSSSRWSSDDIEEHHISEPRINDRIRVAEVRLVGPAGEQVGIVRLEDALRLAQDADLDLVEVAPDARPPVVKIMDFGKFKYEADMKAREARRNQANTVLKEIRFRLKIDPHDYGTKVGHIERFLKGGDKVKVMIQFRGREQSRPEMGIRLLSRLADDVAEFGLVESSPKQDGRNMVMVIAPVKKKAEQRSEARRAAAVSEQRHPQAAAAVAPAAQVATEPVATASVAAPAAASSAPVAEAVTPVARTHTPSPAVTTAPAAATPAAPRPVAAARPTTAPSSARPASGAPRPATRPGAARPAASSGSTARAAGASGSPAPRPAASSGSPTPRPSSASGSSTARPASSSVAGDDPATARPRPTPMPRPPATSATPRPAPRPGPRPSAG